MSWSFWIHVLSGYMELFESPAPSPSQIVNGVREEVTECESNQRLENIYHLRE